MRFPTLTTLCLAAILAGAAALGSAAPAPGAAAKKPSAPTPAPRPTSPHMMMPGGQPPRMPNPAMAIDRPFGAARLPTFESLLAFDKDGDGALTREEYEAGMRELFDLFDADRDARIQRTELTRPEIAALLSSAAARSHEILQRYDTNRDRKIAPDEALVPPKAFARMDANKSGALETEDLEKITLLQAATLREPPRRAQLLLEELDKNKDQKLSAAEFTLSQKAFQETDRNADSLLDVGELTNLPPLPLEHPLRQAQAMLERMDRNKDQKISKEEFQGVGLPFEQLDTNKDGQIDAKEMGEWYARGGLAAFRAEQPGAAVDIAGRVLAQFDRNGDQKLSQEEMAELPGAMWQRWDLNGDGVVEADEIRKSSDRTRMPGAPGAPGAPRPGMPGQVKLDPAEIFKANDRNKDGKLTVEELELGPEMFTKIDANRDGEITPEEVDASMKAAHGGMGVPMPPRAAPPAPAPKKR